MALNLLKVDVYTFLWVAMLPVVVCLQGFYLGIEGNNYVTNIYAISTILLLFPFLAFKGVPVTFYYLVASIALFIVVISLRGLYYDQVPVRDYYMIARSWLLFIVVYFYFRYCVNTYRKHEYARNLFYLFWLFVGISLFLSKISSIGYHTYPAFSSGFRFWFPATNELSFFYISTFMVLYYLSDDIKQKLCYLLVTLYIFTLLGTKIFVVFLAMLVMLDLIYYIKGKFGRVFSSSVIVICFLLLALSVMYIESVAMFISYILLEFSDGASKLIVKIQHLGVVSAMLGERDALIGLGLSYFSDQFSVGEMLFGKTMTVYISEFAVYRRSAEFGMVENDMIDIFLSYGFLAVVFYLVFLYKMSGVKKLFGRRSLSVGDKISITQGSLMLVSGLLSGHVIFFTLPMFASAIIFGCFRNR